GDKDLVSQAMKFCGIDLNINLVADPDEGEYTRGTIDLIDLDNVDIDKLEIGKIQAMAGQAAFEYIKKAVEIAMDKKIHAIATTPINKESLKAANIPYI